MPPPSLYIGLDAGGTKTALRARTAPNEASVSLIGPPANLQRSGLDTTAQVLVDLIRQAISMRSDAVLGSICAGIAGAANPADRQALALLIRTLLAVPDTFPIRLTHDGAIALEGAFDGESGVVVIAGTGSVLFGRTRSGEILQTGGWGFLLGDEGSGYALGLDGLRAVAHAFDGGAPTNLQRLLAERHGLSSPEHIKHQVYREAWPIQDMALLVLDAAEDGDAVARHLVARHTEALARQATWLSRRTTHLDTRLALLGGLTRSPFYQTALREALHTALPGWTVQEPLYPPVVGALRLAEQALV